MCVSQVTSFSSIDSTTLFRLACLGFDSMIKSYTINQSSVAASVRMRSKRLLCAYFLADHYHSII